MKPPRAQANADLGFQIAPMIDVVFVILVFFMALAGQIRVEQILQSRLPGVAVSGTSTEFVDEQIIRIGEGGEVALNDETHDGGAVDGPLPGLTSVLAQLKQSSEAAKAKLMVTVLAHPETPYQRTVDVLNALAAAGVTNVTFTTADEEDAW